MTTNNEPSRSHATITLATRTSLRMRVEATASDGTRGGNLIASRGASITWRADTEAAAYVVRFYELSTGRSTWPFAGDPSGADKDGQFLRVTADGVTLTLLREAPNEIKYEVEAEAGDAQPLDPVFIIRPPLTV